MTSKFWAPAGRDSFTRKNNNVKTANLFPRLIHENRIWRVCKNRERIRTLSPTLEWEERRGRREATHRTPPAPPTTTAKRSRRFALSAALTHLHEELPLLHQGLASLAALLDHPAANTKQRDTKKWTERVSNPQRKLPECKLLAVFTHLAGHWV